MKIINETVHTILFCCCCFLLCRRHHHQTIKSIVKIKIEKYFALFVAAALASGPVAPKNAGGGGGGVKTIAGLNIFFIFS